MGACGRLERERDEGEREKYKFVSAKCAFLIWVIFVGGWGKFASKRLFVRKFER